MLHNRGTTHLKPPQRLHPSSHQPHASGPYAQGLPDYTSRKVRKYLCIHDNKYLPILVELDCLDNNVARVNADGGCGAIGLVTVDTVNVDHPLLPVDLGDFALSPLVLPSYNQNLVVLTNRERADLAANIINISLLGVA